MKLFHETNYKIYNEKANKNLSFVILSDLHFSYRIKNDKLDRIFNEVKNIKPDYILFPGDIIDSTDMIKDHKEEKRFLSWLKKLGTIAPVLMSLGSHDFFKKDLKKWKYNFDEKFYKKMDSVENVYLLDNSSYEDKNIFVVGYTQSFEYYHPNKILNIFKPINEDKSIMLKEVKELNKKIKTNSKKLNLLLVHSPVCVIEPEILKELNNYDFFISGHMHNGCVPPVLYELWNSTRGLIAPNFQLFPKNERNTLRKRGDKLLVNGPLTMFHECTGLLDKVNIFFPSYFSTLNITNDINFDIQKIFIKKKYKK